MTGLPACRGLVAGSDLSKGSDAAVRLAVAWAAWREIPLTIVHAHAGPLDDAQRADVEAALRVEARESAAEELGVDVRFEIVDGEGPDPFRPEEGSDPFSSSWLVVGCEGGSATLLRQAGHVPARLAAEAARPVLLAPLGWSAPPRRRHRVPAGASMPARKRESATFQRILVGMSGPPRDARLLDAAIGLAGGASTATIALAHVIDVSSTRHEPASVRESVRSSVEPRVREAEARLTDLAADRVPVEMAARCDVQVHVIAQGPIERDLAGLAGSQSAELLVVGGGPVAARLVAFAPCPVLVLPASGSTIA